MTVLVSCSQMPVTSSVDKSKTMDFNPPKILGISNGSIEDKVKSAQKAGRVASEFLATDFFLKGNDASVRGEFQSAILYFKAAVELMPTDHYLKKKLAFEMIRSGELNEAEKILEQAFVHNGSQDEMMGLVLANIYSTLEKNKEAKQIYQRLLAVHPESEEACLYLAKIYVVDKLFKEVHSLLNTCQKKTPDNPAFSFFKGRVDYDRGLKSQANVYFQKSLEIDPTYTQAVLAIGALYEEKEDFISAMKIYKKFVDIEDNSTNTKVLARLVTIMFTLEKNDEVLPYALTLSNLDSNDLNLKVRLGLLYSDMERFDEASKLFKEVLVVVPESDKVLYYLGALLQQTGKPEEAVLYFKKILPDSPLFSDAGLQAGQLLAAIAREDLAKGNQAASLDFEKFIAERDSAIPEVQIELKMLHASFLEDTLQFKKAIEVLQSLKTHKNYTENHNYYLASIYEKDGQSEAARVIVQQIIEKDPNNAHALNFLGYSYLEKNEKLPMAFEYISKAVSLRPEDGYIRDSLAWYYYQTGKYQEALVEAKKALALVKDDATITKHLGMIYQRLRYYDKAKVYLTEALKKTQAEAEREDVLKLLKDVESGRMPAAAQNP